MNTPTTSIAGLFASLTVLLMATPSAAQEVPADACLASYRSSQSERSDGNLLQAREQLLRCAQASCPEVVARKCSVWLDEVNAAMPSVVVVARDRDGNDTTDVSVVIDGEVVRERLDGREIELDPGEHEFEFRHPGASPMTRTVVAVEGRQKQPLEVSFRALASDEPTSVSPLVWAGLGVALVGVVVGSVTGGLSLSKSSELQQQCPTKVGCDPALQSARDDGETLAHVSTVSFAVGGAGIALAVVGLLVGGTSGDEGAPSSSVSGASWTPLIGPGFVGAQAHF